MKTREKGITLIALVITIIVLLILAGVAIATLSGENGLFARAKQAKQTQTESEIKEKLNLSIQELQVEKLAEATLNDITQEWLTQKLSEYNPILKEDGTTNSKKVTLQKNGIIKTYMIDENLNITEVENEGGIEFSYEIKSRNNGIIQLLIKIRDNENGINRIECANGNVIQCYGTREEKGIDQEIEVGTEYKFKVISTSGKEREETILIEPEIIVGESYIGTSTTNTNASSSVANNSQTRGTTVYINFTATLEKFGTACTVKLKGGTDSDTLPYAITKNGTYTFVVTGTYGDGKIITEEVEVKVNKYKSAENLVQYDAGEWTEAEINELKEQNLYMLNKEKKINNIFNSDDTLGLNLTFGGFTYKEDTANVSYINNGTIITSRNQSVSPQSGYGTPAYEGWRIFELKDSSGNIISSETEISNKLDNLSPEEKIYVTKLIHAGSPENFVFKHKSGFKTGFKAEYILSSGMRQISYNTFQPRDWSMYEDKTLKAKEYIDEVHAMTYEEATNTIREYRRTNSNYWLATNNSETELAAVRDDGYLSLGATGILDDKGRCYGIRPVVVMNEGVYIASGDGTEASPYVLGKD